MSLKPTGECYGYIHSSINSFELLIKRMIESARGIKRTKLIPANGFQDLAAYAAPEDACGAAGFAAAPVLTRQTFRCALTLREFAASEASEMFDMPVLPQGDYNAYRYSRYRFYWTPELGFVIERSSES